MVGQSLRKRSISALLMTSLAIGGGLAPLDGGVLVTRADTLTSTPLAASGSVGAGPYTMVDLTTVAGGTFVPEALNNAGQVAGFILAAGSVDHAAVWSARTGMTDLGTLGGPNSSASDINDNGQVVGSSDTISGTSDVFLWSANTGMTDTGVTGGGARVNNAGQVLIVGYSSSFWSPSTGAVSLGGDASAINDSGQIVGANDQGYAAWWGTSGGITGPFRIPTVGASYGSLATDIANTGEVVATADDGYGNTLVLAGTTSGLSPAGINTLPTDPSGCSKVCAGIDAEAVNDSGTVVGSSSAASGGAYVANLMGGCTSDLNGLVPATPGVTLGQAMDINNTGQILASGLSGSADHTFLLTPALGFIISPCAVLGFNNQPLGTVSNSHAVTLTNDATTPLTINSLSMTGTNSTDFTVAGTTCMGGPIAPGDHCTVSVSFAPTAVGFRIADLAINDDGPVSQERVLLAGVATDTTPPTTMATLSPAPNGAGWNNSAVTVTLTAVDNPGGSGVYQTMYAFDDPTCVPPGIGPCTVYTAPFPLTAEGRHAVYFFSIDYVGNSEQQRSVAVNLDETPPQTTVALTGTLTGHGAYVGPVTVTLAAHDTLSGVAATLYRLDAVSTMTYTAPFTVAAPGLHTISYASTDLAGNTEATHAATVTIALPALHVHPTSGVYGQRITLTGANFGRTETVNIYGDRTGGTPIYTAHTNASGAFTLTATVLAGPYGPHTLIAIGQTSGLTARTTFVIKPRLILRPTAGAPGTTTLVSGYGFGATEKVTVRWNTATGTLLATATSTSAGSLRTVFKVPASKRGGYLVYGTGQRTRATAAALFTVM